MISTNTLKTAGVVVLALAIAVKLKLADDHVVAARRSAAAASLALSNTAAERDSTRDAAEAHQRVAGLLGDSLRMVERRSLQIVQRADALDRALDAERIEHAAMRTTVDSVRQIAFAPSASLADSAGARRAAHFELRQPPYHIVADAELPMPPDSGTLAVRVALDPIPIDVRLECSRADASGIRTASIAATAPRWAQLRLDHVEQSAELCASPALAQVTGRLRGRLIPLVLGVGTTLSARGVTGWGLFLGAGLAL